MRRYDFKMKSVPLSAENLMKYDCVVIVTDHSNYDYEFIVKHSKLVVDTRNATKNLNPSNKIIKA
jgi:UDP-N-acetyl-D-glucosamine dehydrogenase